MMEYGFLVQTCDLPTAAASVGERAEAIANSLASLSEPIHRSLESLDSGGWQVVSHNVLQTDNSLIVTFLIGRNAKVRPGHTPSC